MKIYFLFLLTSYKCITLTFENMFNTELENLLKEKEKEYRKIESKAECNIIVFFSLEKNKLAFKSITEIRNNFFSELNIKNTGNSNLAIEHKNRETFFLIEKNTI